MTQLATQSLKKHVGAIHVSGKLSLLKRKIANVLLLNAYHELTDVDEHRIGIQELADIAGFNSKDFELLKDAFRDLAKTTVEWNILSDDGTEDWTVSTLLCRATIRRGQGVCLYAYDRELSKKLYHPDMYARINLTIQRKFKSGYALVLYENCARFRGVNTTGWISVADWRRLFGIESGEYREFKDFAKRVLKPAIAEVNRESDLSVEADYRRENRKVSQIRFTISEQVEVDSTALAQLENKDFTTLLERLIGVGITKAIASKLILEHDVTQIERNLDYVEAEIRGGKRIKNLGGYMVKAIQADYGLAESNRRETLRQAERQVQKQECEQAERAAIIERDRKDATERLKSSFEALSDADKQALIDETAANLKAGDFLFKEYRKRGLKSILFYQAVLATYKQKDMH